MARLYYPLSVAVDSAGNIYVADSANTIRKATPAGWVTTLAGQAFTPGNADGTGTNAQFQGIYGLTADAAGNVFVADQYNEAIRKVTPEGAVTTLAGNASITNEFGRLGGYADGAARSAQFNFPRGVAVDAADNLYVADWANNAIRKVTPAGVVSTLAGLPWSLPPSADGTGNEARFNDPAGVAVDNKGTVYVADQANNTIRRITPTGVVTTLAGQGGSRDHVDAMGDEARFAAPSGVATDQAGNIYVADTDNSTLRKVTPAGAVVTLAGRAGSLGSDDGAGSAARFSNPWGVAVDALGNIYVTDANNPTIRKVTPTGIVTTLAGLAGSPGNADGTGSAARFGGLSDLAVGGDGNIYVADTGNQAIRIVTPAGVVTTLGLTGSAVRFGYPHGVAVDSAGTVYVSDSGRIYKVTPAGAVTTLAVPSGSPLFGTHAGLAMDGLGNVYLADGLTIQKVTPEGKLTTLAGLAGAWGCADGTGSAARFSTACGLAIDRVGNLYVADRGNNTIRKGFPAPVPLMIVASVPSLRFDQGRFSLIVAGLPGPSIVVEASTNLMSWLPIWTNAFTGALSFSDPQSAAYSNRFYRARTQ